MIREIMLDPGKLRGCIDTGGRLDDQSIAAWSLGPNFWERNFDDGDFQKEFMTEPL